jgi:hypothetical protein
MMYSALWQVGEWVGGKKEFDLPLYTLGYNKSMIFKAIEIIDGYFTRNDPGVREMGFEPTDACAIGS